MLKQLASMREVVNRVADVLDPTECLDVVNMTKMFNKDRGWKRPGHFVRQLGGNETSHASMFAGACGW